ncbi:MAG: SPOR domain-containing protein [Balneolaceae bacterium]|nr:SPOR domain-containing protein [Balneolaceae bacterium]MDR9410816.1 SPOR domain-containing protein [Balneolaceae bacterium]
MTSIGAAWAASKIHEKEFSDLSLLPEYIREKQRVLKLEWHGIAILMLIALTPLYLNYLYQAKSSQLTDLQQEIQILDNQIEELRPTATMTEDLMSEISILNAENERLLELAQYNQQWSETFRILNEGIADIPNVWLENLSTADNNSLNFNGYSMNRSQIPEFASIFTDANIQQVSQTEMRGATVYSFGMRVNNIRQDIEPFLQEMPEQSFDTEQGSEVEINFSSNELSEDMPAEEITAPVSESQSSAMSSSSQSPEIEQTEVSEIAESEPMGSGIEPNGDDNEQTDNNPASFKEPPIINSPSQSSFGLMGPENQMLEGAYTIVLHSITDEQRAGREVEILEEEGYKATLWDVVLEDNKRWWRIGVGQFQTVSAALEAVQELTRAYRERNFIIRIREGR